MEAYIYTYVNKETGKTYIGSRSAYKGSCYDDFNIKYFSSSKDKQFRQDMADGKLEGQIVLVMNDPNANRKIVDVESKMITAYWDKYGKENSYNHHNNDGKWSTSGMKFTFSEKHKKHMSDSQYLKGKHLSEDVKKKISDANSGKIRSYEFKTMLSKLFSAEHNPFYGKHHSEETKDKMRKPKTDEHKLKLRKPKKKYKWLTPDGEIKEMTKSNVLKWHRDWIKLD